MGVLPLGRLAAAWLALAALAGGCNARVGPAGAAAINTAIAAGFAGARRAGGDCFTWCGPGTQCNPATGLCESVSCGGECKAGERCDTSGPVPQCVPEVDNDMNIRQGTQDPTSPVKEPPPPLE